jgi:uncharacterized repeat protein (TIGR04076 family)
MTEKRDDEFSLYDLNVVVEAVGERCTCTMSVGDSFILKGGKIAIPGDRDFCLYALQAVIPLLPAKQRMNSPADWMETDAYCTCPDPACALRMRIDRVKVTTFRHDDVSALPWDEVKPQA